MLSYAGQYCSNRPTTHAGHLMAVTKRVRFEILRRDNHACQYCGLVAPDTELTIDHVIPVALGGTDKPDNLVAACKDCNAGKTSISPDSPIVAAVGARAAEYAIAQANRAARIEADLSAIEEYQEDFLTAWEGWGYGPENARTKIPLPADWRGSLSLWWKMSVPSKLVQDSIPIAMLATRVDHDARFRYFAGVIWRTLDDYDAKYPDGGNEGRVYSWREVEEHGTRERLQGYMAGRHRTLAETHPVDDILVRFVDGRGFHAS